MPTRHTNIGELSFGPLGSLVLCYFITFTTNQPFFKVLIYFQHHWQQMTQSKQNEPQPQRQFRHSQGWRHHRRWPQYTSKWQESTQAQQHPPKKNTRQHTKRTQSKGCVLSFSFLVMVINENNENCRYWLRRRLVPTTCSAPNYCCGQLLLGWKRRVMRRMSLTEVVAAVTKWMRMA